MPWKYSKQSWRQYLHNFDDSDGEFFKILWDAIAGANALLTPEWRGC